MGKKTHRSVSSRQGSFNGYILLFGALAAFDRMMD
jgi:hypothetical protein